MHNVARSVAAPTQLQLGDWVLGKYQIETLLGAGAMGIVYRALHADLERHVAVKVARPELAQHPTVVARMLAEARAAAQLSSEHIVRVLDVGQLPSGDPFIVMEYLDGEDLRSVLEREGPLEFERALDYVLQACTALAEAHQCGIVHRDLKPENLFLGRRPDGTPILKVFDFGISKQVGRVKVAPALTQANSLVGSPHYMAPEQMQGVDDIDGRTDVWSLGVLLHEFLTQTVPFDGDTLPVICANVLNSPAVSVRTLRPELPEAFAQVILRCLEKTREQRYASVLELKAALEPFLRARHLTASGVRATAAAGFLAPRAGRTSSGAEASCAPVVAAAGVPVLQRPPRRQRLWLVSGLLGVALGVGLLWRTALVAGDSPAVAPSTDSPLSGRAAEPAAVPAKIAESAAPRPAPTAMPKERVQADPGATPGVTVRRRSNAVRRRTADTSAATPNPPPAHTQAAAPDPFDPEEFGGRH